MSITISPNYYTKQIIENLSIFKEYGLNALFDLNVPMVDKYRSDNIYDTLMSVEQACFFQIKDDNPPALRF